MTRLMASILYDVGTVENPKFESEQLRQIKESCQPHCFVGYCYNDTRVIWWLFRQALRGFQGVTNPE